MTYVDAVKQLIGALRLESPADVPAEILTEALGGFSSAGETAEQTAQRVIETGRQVFRKQLFDAARVAAIQSAEADLAAAQQALSSAKTQAVIDARNASDSIDLGL